MPNRVKYVTVSIPKAVSEKIDYCVDRFGYWPSRSSFVREAVLEKCDREARRIGELRTVAEFDADSIAEEKRKRELRVATRVEEVI